ncbi:MAG: PDZ domain-containing protein, partial [Candidatus Eremiobacteraeota bacterium]|nr:PDZ domain-containing protein [Candidatus Eremiobacteraeota bacterium]
LTLALIIGDLVHGGPAGDFGFEKRDIGPRTTIVTAVEPNSPAARAGIAVGDRIAVASGDLASRVSYFFGAAAPGARLRLIVDHRGTRRHVAIRAASQPLPQGEGRAIYGLLGAIETIRIVFVLVAALIVLRRPERDDARALASFLIAFSFGTFSRWPWVTTPLAASLYVVHFMAFWFSLLQAVRFASIFPQRSGRGIRRSIERQNPWATLATVAFFGVSNAWPMLTSVETNGTLENGIAALIGLYCTVALVLGFLIGRREAIPSDRERIKWIGLSTAIGLGGLLTGVILQALGSGETISAAFFSLVLAIPLGTAYAILRHRMLDIGFVVNRALVFGIISALVVGAFSLLEFLLGKYVTSLGHVQSAVLEAVLALGISVSMGRIHERVNRFVDAVFFRERHRAEAALRRLAQEASYVDDPAVLAERIVTGVDRHAGASGTALYVVDGNSSFRRLLATLADVPLAVERNNAAIVRMRASSEPVDLGELAIEVESPAMPGKIAFPMIVRGTLVGTLCCGPKRNHEDYAPDERATLADLTHAAGIAFDTMQTNSLRSATARAIAERTLEPLLHVATGFEQSTA